MGRLIRRGEIRWYEFPRPEKRRPVLVLSRDSVLEYLGEATVAPLTRTIRDIPSEVVVGPNQGMPEECSINVDHLQTVSKARLGSLITTLPEPAMAEVCRALKFALRC